MFFNFFSIENKDYDVSFAQYSECIKLEHPFSTQIKKLVVLHGTKDLGGIPSFLEFQPVSYTSLETYLTNRNSLLSENEYLDTLISVSSEFEISPALLLAIAGQEQGFIPADNESSTKIINNPYNVFGSWKEYNTTFRDSTEIAARTVTNILSKRPAEMDPFIWLNKTYAEDVYWHKGVRFFFNDIIGTL